MHGDAGDDACMVMVMHGDGDDDGGNDDDERSGDSVGDDD